MLLSRYGWGVLCVAGGGAYYFAKRSINSDRAARHEIEFKKQARLRQLEQSAYAQPSQDYKKQKKTSKQSSSTIEAASDAMAGASATVKDTMNQVEGLDHAGDQSSEASEDVAVLEHALETKNQKSKKRSQYEATEPYRSKKGDRFS